MTSLPALASSSVPSSSNVPAVIASNESLVGRYCGKKLPGPVVSEVGNFYLSMRQVYCVLNFGKINDALFALIDS